jgi:hypothetical protein
LYTLQTLAGVKDVPIKTVVLTEIDKIGINYDWQYIGTEHIKLYTVFVLFVRNIPAANKFSSFRLCIE